MFSGEVPFYEDKNDIRVILSVMQGKRPRPPSHDSSKTRGLSDVVWQLIETCWGRDPIKRLTATQIIERLSALPNLPVDERPVNDFDDINLPSQMLCNHAEHPFSALFITQNPLEPHNSQDVPGLEPLAPSFGQDGYAKPNWPAARHASILESNIFEDIKDNIDAATRSLSLRTIGSEDEVMSAKRLSPQLDSFASRKAHARYSFGLLSHIAIKLKDRVPRGMHVKGSIPYPRAFTGKDIVVSLCSILIYFEVSLIKV